LAVLHWLRFNLLIADQLRPVKQGVYNRRVTDGGFETVVIGDPISVEQVRQMAVKSFGDMVKAVVDIRLRLVALGAELHADEEFALLERGSEQVDLWGINIYPDKPRSDWVEFDSVINVRPRQNNRSRSVEDASTRQLIVDIVNSLVL